MKPLQTGAIISIVAMLMMSSASATTNETDTSATESNSVQPIVTSTLSLLEVDDSPVTTHTSKSLTEEPHHISVEKSQTNMHPEGSHTMTPDPVHAEHKSANVDSHHDTSTGSHSSESTNDRITVGGPHGGPTVEETEDEKYSWWRIVVVLVVFCAMAGVILWILKLTAKCQAKREKEDEESSIEEDGFDSGEKLSTSRV